MSQIVIERPPAAPRSAAEVGAALTFITRSDEKPVFHSSALTGGRRGCCSRPSATW